MRRRGAADLPAVANFVRLILERYGHQPARHPARRKATSDTPIERDRPVLPPDSLMK